MEDNCGGGGNTGVSAVCENRNENSRGMTRRRRSQRAQHRRRRPSREPHPEQLRAPVPLYMQKALCSPPSPPGYPLLQLAGISTRHRLWTLSRLPLHRSCTSQAQAGCTHTTHAAPPSTPRLSQPPSQHGALHSWLSLALAIAAALLLAALLHAPLSFVTPNTLPPCIRAARPPHATSHGRNTLRPAP
eukprot:COSAG02_NODE_4027_length_5886_cov_4.820287_1_plen_187_part_10